MQNFSVLSWNIQGNFYRGTGTKFSKIAPFLQRNNFDIICLEEIPNAATKLNSFKGFNIFIPESNKIGNREFNHNVVITKFPIVDGGELKFSSTHASILLENTTYVTVKLENALLRLYVCHFAIDGAGPSTRLKQLEQVASHAAQHQGPSVICGDMNVTIPKLSTSRIIIKYWHQEPESEMRDGDEREIFNKTAQRHGYREVFDLYTPTWSPFHSKKAELFKLKLDWFFTKNLTVSNRTMGPYISDHRPLIVNCVL